MYTFLNWAHIIMLTKIKHTSLDIDCTVVVHVRGTPSHCGEHFYQVVLDLPPSSYCQNKKSDGQTDGQTDV